MKNRIALLSLALVGGAFAYDEYMPVAPGALEIDVAYAPTFVTGFYDDDGEKQDIIGDPMGNGVGVQLKYGVMPGLDLELAWVYLALNEDAGDASGFLQPEIAVKYAVGTTGIGVLGNVILPLVTGDFDTDPSDVALGIEPGVIYGKNYGSLQAIAKASYVLYLENGDEYKPGNELNVFLKPGYMVDDKLAGYLGIDYTMYSESEGAGTGLDDDGYLLTLLPGLTYTLDGSLAFELNVPFTLAGQNAGAGWGVNALLYYTLGL